MPEHHLTSPIMPRSSALRPAICRAHPLRWRSVGNRVAPMPARLELEQRGTRAARSRGLALLRQGVVPGRRGRPTLARHRRRCGRPAARLTPASAGHLLASAYERLAGSTGSRALAARLPSAGGTGGPAATKASACCRGEVRHRHLVRPATCSGLLPALHALGIPVDLGVAEFGHRPLGGVPGHPAIGVAVEDDRLDLSPPVSRSSSVRKYSANSGDSSP